MQFFDECQNRRLLRKLFNLIDKKNNEQKVCVLQWNFGFKSDLFVSENFSKAFQIELGCHLARAYFIN